MALQERLSKLGLMKPDILLPRKGIDLRRWAVIACDQHTSNRGYWDRIASQVGDSPSTLNLVLPEVYLKERGIKEEADRIGRTAREYLGAETFTEYAETPILIRRESSDGALRPGILFALDLEQYEYRPGSKSLVRASELTIEERLPPRVLIREASPLELPHILVLIDDRESTVIEPLSETFGASRGEQEPLYETELLEDGGRVTGYAVDDATVENKLLPALEALAAQRPDFVYAAGDGNHSLAAAKEVWERRKRAGAPANHLSRWALVELVNLYTPGLRFEPIHRLITGPGLSKLPEALSALAAESAPTDQSEPGERQLLLHLPEKVIAYSLPEGDALPIATVEDALARLEGVEVDYVHGEAETIRLARENHGAALLVPPIDRELLFPTVAQRGVLPQKAFSLGHSEEKRYYMEARRIE